MTREVLHHLFRPTSGPRSQLITSVGRLSLDSDTDGFLTEWAASKLVAGLAAKWRTRPDGFRGKPGKFWKKRFAAFGVDHG